VSLNRRQAILVRAGQFAADYFTDTGECLFCDVDERRARGGPPVHEESCPLGPLESGQSGRWISAGEPTEADVAAASEVLNRDDRPHSNKTGRSGDGS
jgi:hypothetical protein